MSRTWPAAVALAVAAAALIASTGFHGHREARPAGPNVPVGAGARDPGGIEANNSPTLVRDPTRPATLVVVNRIDSPEYSCAVHVSQDGGRRWSALEVPIPSGEEPKCYAPDAAYGPDGTLYVSYVTLRGIGNRPHAVWIASSRDGGRTLSAPRRALGPLAFQVRLATDPRRAGRLYLAWLQATDVGLFLFPHPGNRINVMRSEDGGRTWTPPTGASDPRRLRVLAPVPVVEPGRAVDVLYLDVGEDRLDYEGGHGGSGGPPYAGRFSLVLSRSIDGGASWRESVVDDRVVPTRRFLAFLPPFPSVAVDGESGRIYAAFEDARHGSSDVHLWSLDPGTARWSGPVRVNDTPPRDRSTQSLPKIAVAPGGRLDVVYYDRRDDPRDRLSGVSLQSSFDGGRTFAPALTLTDRRFDSRIGAGSERGLADLGSRLGIVSDDSSVLAAWTDTRSGTEASNKQDIAFAVVELSRPGSLPSGVRSGLRYGGLVLLAVGVVALLGRISGAGALAVVALLAVTASAQAATPPDDPLFRFQWNLAAIQIPAAWDVTRGAGATVAILDTGVAYERRGPFRRAPDLRGTRFVPGWDFVDGDAHPDDVPPRRGRRSHGTHIAGIIAATAGNRLGAAGVAPDVAIMPIRVLDPDLAGTARAIARGLRFAADHGADVANLSIAGTAPSPVVEAAVDYAVRKGVTVVAAAGNDGAGSVSHPAAYRKVIAVGAVAEDGTRAGYSNYGDGLDLVAPGGAGDRADTGFGPGDGVVAQTVKGGPAAFCFCFMASTSAAAAHVSAVAALVIASGRATTPADVAATLAGTARDLGPRGRDLQYGAGLVQARAALAGRRQRPAAARAPTGLPADRDRGPALLVVVAVAAVAALVTVGVMGRGRRATG